MVSKTQIRNANRKAVYKADPTGKKTKNWEMSKFRHALFQISEECTKLKSVDFKLNLKNKWSVCTLYFNGRYFICSYDYTKQTVSVLTTVNQRMVKKVMSVEEFPEYIKRLQPKKIIIKRKSC